MSKVERFSVSLEGSLLKAFDRYLAQMGYTSRSEAVRDLIREKLVARELEHPRAEGVGVVTLVYDHHQRELPEKLTEIQHRFFREITSTSHIHLDRHNCLEVIIVRARAKRIRNIADLLISTKGVKHGRLVTTTAAKDLS